jgi:3-phenylpropionate/cinnamic acid dioxygenase small subunit
MPIEKTVAREQIRDVVARYNIAGDRRDLEAFLETFTEDAIYESAVFRCLGRHEIKNYLTEAWRQRSDVPTARFRRHHITTSQIDLTGPDTADGRVYYLVTTDLGLDHCGFYVDRYRRVADFWRIAHREVWMDWAVPESLFVPEISKKLVADTGAAGPPAHR